MTAVKYRFGRYAWHSLEQSSTSYRMEERHCSVGGSQGEHGWRLKSYGLVIVLREVGELAVGDDG